MEARDMKQVTVDNCRNMRYGEIFIIKPTGLEVYNTTGLNDCPAELWDALDVEAIEKEFGAMSVQKNGPHFWMMDWQQLALGERLKLVDGWEYRTRVLSEDLTLDLGPEKTIYAVGDDFHQYYTRI